MIKLTPKIIIMRILAVVTIVAVFTFVAVYYKNTVF